MADSIIRPVVTLTNGGDYLTIKHPTLGDAIAPEYDPSAVCQVAP